jgi:putative copper resistance protein D
MLEAGLILSRFAHYLAVTALFGVALFPLYSGPSRGEGQPARLSRWLAATLAMLSLAVFLTSLLWLTFSTANMNGELAAAVEPTALSSVIYDTGFGRLWIVRLTLSGLLLAVTVARLLIRADRQPGAPVFLLAAALLVTLAGTGHTQGGDHVSGLLHVAADGAHLLAAGAWFGGLAALGFTLRQPAADAEAVLRRFSGMGYVAVAVLVGSGVVNSWFLVGSISRLTTTAYGQILLIKLFLFAGMLALATANQFWLVPSLMNNDGQQDLWLARLRRHVMGEQALGVLVLLVVGILGTLEPAFSQS